MAVNAVDNPFAQFSHQMIGDIQVIVNGNKNWEDMEGIFSITLYYRNEEQIESSIYYNGIWSYIAMAAKLNKRDGRKVGIFLITDEDSFPKLSAFYTTTSKDFLTIVKVRWPLYELTPTKMDDSILRCMRYLPLGMPQLAGKWIATRDADTLFPHDLCRISYTVYSLHKNLFKMEKHGEKDFIVLNYAPDKCIFFPEYTDIIADVMSDLLLNWEKTFVDIYRQREHSIVLSTCPGYIYLGRMKNYNPNHMRLYMERNRPEIFTQFFGLFAGFATFFSNRPENVWETIRQFLTRRYHIVIESGRISNSDYNPLGKDELILMYAIVPTYLNQCTLCEVSYTPAKFYKFPIEFTLNTADAEYYGIRQSLIMINALKMVKGVVNDREVIEDFSNLVDKDVFKRIFPPGLDSDTNLYYEYDQSLRSILKTYALQPDLVQAMSTLNSIKFRNGISGSYDEILRNHVEKYNEWKDRFFPDPVPASPPMGGAALTGRKRRCRTKRNIRHRRKTRTRNKK